MGGAITISNREDHIIIWWRAWAWVLTQDVEKGDSEVPLGMALTPCRLSLLRDQVSEDALCLSFSILLYLLASTAYQRYFLVKRNRELVIATS